MVFNKYIAERHKLSNMFGDGAETIEDEDLPKPKNGKPLTPAQNLKVIQITSKYRAN